LGTPSLPDLATPHEPTGKSEIAWRDPSECTRIRPQAVIEEPHKKWNASLDIAAHYFNLNEVGRSEDKLREGKTTFLKIL